MPFDLPKVLHSLNYLLIDPVTVTVMKLLKHRIRKIDWPESKKHLVWAVMHLVEWFWDGNGWDKNRNILQ